MNRIIESDGCRDQGELLPEEFELDRKRTSFIIRNKLRKSAGKTRLGVFWLILDPVAMSLVYLFVLTVVRSSPSAESLFIGVSMFRIFRSSFMSGINSITDYTGGIICERVRTRVLISASIRFRILEAVLQSSGIGVILLFVLNVGIITVFSFILLSVLMALLAEGFGTNFTRAIRRIPDLSNIVNYILLLMFFGSPVLYPMSITMGMHYAVNEVNPFSYFVETVRFFAGLESVIFDLPELQTAVILFVVVILSLRGYLQIDRLRWEVSAWS